MSNFLKTVLLEKDRQIEQLRSKCEVLEDESLNRNEERMRLEAQLKSVTLSNQELNVQIEEMQSELQKIMQENIQNEGIIEELKDKYKRVLLE